MIKGIIKQIPKRPRLRPVCEFTTANHRDGATRMGGSFGAGFLSGSLGSYLGSSRHSKNMFEMIGNTVRDAVVGGTISVIGGGKFASTKTTAHSVLHDTAC
jgi:hypothetical protein